MALQLALTSQAALPDSAPIDDTLGWVYLKQGLIPQAIRAFRHAADLAPGDSSIRYHLGLAYTRSGDSERVKRELQAALKLHPTFEDAEEAARMLASL